jgi:DNA-binding CsgD family transcriptional regulator
VIRLSAEALEQQFGLTPAEARLAVALASRRTLDEYATLAGVSMNTVRSTLKGVFAKTGCNRQSELVLVLASGAIVTACSRGA